jgi:hemolysin activation/secretion protein
VPGTDTLTAIEFESEAHTWFIGIDHPFIRSRSQNLRGFATFEARNSESRSIGAPISQDRIRSVRLGADYDRALENGSILAASVELSFGIPGFGASANDDSLNSRDEGVVDYQKFSADVSYIIPLGLVASDLNGWTFTSEGTLQLTADPLLASEECAFGGGTYGRAFDFSALSGDQCAALSLEVGRELQPDRNFQNLRYYAFTERAAVRNLDSTAAGSWATITSAGLGSEIDFNESVYGIFEVAFPMENSTVATLDRTPRATFSLNMEF